MTEVRINNNENMISQKTQIAKDLTRIIFQQDNAAGCSNNHLYSVTL